MNEPIQQQDDVIPHGEAIVERFGGIRPMASKLNVPVTTVQGWKKRDAIPAMRRDEILNAAAHHDINLKGLISEGANENSRSGGIAEDPALRMRAVPASAPQPQAQQAQQPRARQEVPMGIDLRQVRKAARRTSFMTTTALLVLVGAAGYVLFAGDVQNSMNAGARVSTLEGRVAAVEQRAPGASADTSLFQAQIDKLSAMGESLTQRLAAIETQLTSANPALSNMVQGAQNMVQTPGGASEWQAAIADLRNIVTGLQGRMDGFEGALTQAKTQNDALGRQLSDLSGHDLGAAAMLLALTQLRESIDRQAPFTDDLALLQQVAANNDPELAASIARMAPYAQTGVLSPGGLKRELQASANDIITAKMRGENVSVKEKIMARLQGLFSIKKDGLPLAGSEEHALIERASAQLDHNDVAGAMATLQQLNGPAAAAAAPWQAKAQATMGAQALDAQLVKTIMSKIKTGLSAAVPSAVPGVVNAGPINMAPSSTPAPQAPAVTPMAPPPATVAPVEPQAGLPDMPAPSDVIQQ